jgi:hypothetical protein
VGLTRWERSETATAFNDDEDEDEHQKLPPLSATRHRPIKHSPQKSTGEKHRKEMVEDADEMTTTTPAKGRNGSVSAAPALTKEDEEERRKVLREIEVCFSDSEAQDSTIITEK